MFDSISPKQAEIYKFPHEDYDALICDGAVRSGKSSMMMVAFIWWAMERFTGANFGICGRAVQVAERNLVKPTLALTSLRQRYTMKYLRSQSLLTVDYQGHKNYFYLFGGKDEASYTLIQGITLSGILFDEVALMPRSFVEQGISRTLSVDEAKLWFNCNPENPEHWFYKEWILKPDERKAKYLHFAMTDNPGLSERAIERASNSFSGVFYQRAVLGEWVKAEGLIYAQFDALKHTFGDEDAPTKGQWFVSIDYGTRNPFCALLWRVTKNVAYCMREYYHDGRTEGALTDEEHADNIEAMLGDINPTQFYIDPSATSMSTTLRRRYKWPRHANNDVVPGISNTATALHLGKLMFHRSCENTIKEFGLYAWDENASGDRPIKEHDHAMDAVRYFVHTHLARWFGLDGEGGGIQAPNTEHVYWTGKRYADGQDEHT